MNWLVYVENLLKLLSKDTKAINMTFNMLFCMLITHNRAEQCIFKSLRNVHIQTYLRFKIWKNMKGGHLCPLYDHLLRNGSKLGYLSCNFVSNEGIFFLRWVSKTIIFFLLMKNTTSMCLHRHGSSKYIVDFSCSKIDIIPTDKNRVPYFEAKLLHLCAKSNLFLNKWL